MITGNPFIPLAKTPFNDSDIIFRGLTPDYGKVSMLVRRAGQISRTSYPVADIFRELDIEFNDEIISPLKFIELISNVTREDVILAASFVKLNTVYKLLPQEEA